MVQSSAATRLGGIEGSVVRRFDGGFAIAFTATQRKRDKLAAQIWRLNGVDIAEAEEREHPRTPGNRRLTLLLLPDGTALECSTLDISQSGASIVTPIKPPIGAEVVFANRPAAVVRHHDDGIAIEFVNDAFTDDEGCPLLGRPTSMNEAEAFCFKSRSAASG